MLSRSYVEKLCRGKYGGINLTMIFITITTVITFATQAKNHGGYMVETVRMLEKIYQISCMFWRKFQFESHNINKHQA